MSESDGTLKDATPRVDVAKEVVSLSVVEDTVEKEKLSPIVTTTESYPLLPTQVTTSTGNTLGNSSYAKVTVESIRTLSERFANTAYGFFLGKRVANPVVANYVRNTWGKYGLVRSMFSSSIGLFSFQFSSIEGLDAMLENGPYSFLSVRMASSYVRAMIELRADVELKDNIMAAMPKITREDYYTCNIHVEYEWKPPRCVCCKVFGHVLEECPKNIGAGSTKNLKKTSQTPKGIPVGQKMGFKPKHVFQPGIVDSDSEVEVVFDETVNLRLLTSGKDGSDKGYGTNSLLEQWRDSYPDNYDYDLYDDDICENHDMSEHLQSICNDLDIMVPGRKKK
ncbi:hypothetical protein Tco_1508403 [Tanacetum coccineum]